MRLFLLLSIIVLLIACRGDKNKYKFANKKEKFFYTDHRGYDYIRFPLIMPYDVMCINVLEMNWRVDLKVGTDFYYSINKVKELSVMDSLILIHSTSMHQVEVSKDPKQWFVIVPSQRIEIGFSTEEEFKTYLKHYGIKEIKWVNVNQAYEQFEKTGCLPWILGCSESAKE
jgi:glucan-binding YG repeat protein